MGILTFLFILLYDFFFAVQSITYFCGKMIEDNRTAVTSGCFSQVVNFLVFFFNNLMKLCLAKRRFFLLVSEFFASCSA